jgi:hypothetical protein
VGEGFWRPFARSPRSALKPTNATQLNHARPTIGAPAFALHNFVNAIAASPMHPNIAPLLPAYRTPMHYGIR